MESLRVSSYAIPIKLEIEPDKYMLIHGYTGAIDLLDEKSWNQLKNYSQNSSLSEGAIDMLKQRGYLTNKTVEEEQNYVKRIAQTLHKSQMKLQKNWGFVITYDCNFRCPYCFENEISHQGKNWSKFTLTEDLVDKAFDAMLQIEPHKELHHKEILLYGGEPMLREKRNIVKYIVNKGVLNGYKFKVITNGYDINYYEDILDNKIFSAFQITVDGFREKHNIRKKHYKEGNSFDTIMSNIELLLKHEINTAIRINIDENNLSDIETLNSYFQTKGFIGNPYFRMYPSMITEMGEHSEKNGVKYISDYEKFIVKLNEISPKWAHSRDFNIYHNIYSCLISKTCFSLVSTICPAQYGTCLFDPYGCIYPCLEVVGKKEHCIGYYNKNAVEWTEIRSNWYDKNVCEQLLCQTCKFALLCGGRCLARYMRVKDDSSQICKHFPDVFPVSVNQAYNAYINSKLKEDGEERDSTCFIKQ